jgi:CRISPR-associated protein Csx10
MGKGKKQDNRKGSKHSKDKASRFKNSSPTEVIETNSMQVSTDFTLNIYMLSDWHVGTGAGRVGDIDALVQRDHHNLPYIPAKTLTGIWRDSCEMIATGLDNGNSNGVWSQWVTYLFGDQPALEKDAVEVAPTEAALSVRSAHFPDSFVNAISSKKLLLEAITFVKPGISIDPNNGCAKEDFLRFEEMVRAGAVLNSACQLQLENLDDRQKQAAFALLIAGAKLIERLGGKRRRGAGKCQWEIQIKKEKQNSDGWINWLEQNLNALALPETEKEEYIPWTEPITNSSTWVKVDLTVTTLSPLIISKRTIGNVVETLDYIPGTHLMRLIIRKLKHLNFDFGSAIAHNQLVVTNATPEIGGTIGKPTPMTLFGEKLNGGLSKLKEGGRVYNRFLETEPSMQLKGERGGYVSFSNDQIDYEKVETGIETHNTVKDELQRPTTDIGGIYSYGTIPIGKRFKAELRLPQDLAEQLKKQDVNWWQKLSSDNDRLGQSKKDDYGSVKIEAKSPQNVAPKTLANNNLLTVWVLSDILMRDERLRPTSSVKALEKELERKLDVTLEFRKNNDLLSLMARSNRLESWQVRWGLPRPSLVGLAAGSCFVLEITGNTNPPQLEQKLAGLETTGIGERIAEGFGQICFNHSLLSQNTFTSQSSQQSQAASSSSVNQKTTALLSNSQDPNFIYARYIEKATWRKEMQRIALHLAATPDSREQILGIKSKNPTMSQLGALRSVIGALPQTETANQTNGVMGWLAHLRNTPNRKEKWTEASLREIQNLVTNRQLVWSHLDINISEITMTKNAQQQLQQELWAEAVQTLVDAIIRAHKRTEESVKEEK